MNLKLLKLIVINIIIVNYFNYALSSELIIPKNKPSIQKYDIQLNEINYLLPKKKPFTVSEEPKIDIVEKQKPIIAKKYKDVILPLPKPIVVTKIKPPKKSKFYSEKDVIKAKKAIKLSVGGAFHSILMEPARDSLLEFIESLNFSDPEIPLIGNVNAKPLENAGQIKNELIEQLMSCVQWNDTIKYMSSNGLNDYIEFGPGKVLTGLIKRIDSNSSTMNIDSYESLNS
mgnify:CR=1 FL=1